MAKTAKQTNLLQNCNKKTKKLQKCNKVDKKQAVDLKYNHNLSYAEIAAIQKVTPQAIQQAISNLLPIPETKIYRDHRSDILSEMQRKLLASVDTTTINNASLMQRMASFGILYDKERLERGLSTGNFVNIQADLEAFRQAKQVQQDTQDNSEIIDI